MADAMSFGKGGKESEARKKLKISIIAERMCDSATETYVSPAMEWGTAQEPFARSRYEELTGNLVTQCGFVLHDSILDFGCSPDGLVDDDGLIEIKAPTTATYMGWLLDGVVPEQHKPQMLCQLAITKRKWCDFVAYDPRIKYEEHQLFIRRFEPDEADILKVEAAAAMFLDEVDALFQVVISQEVA
jgi:hypothetical protein